MCPEFRFRLGRHTGGRSDMTGGRAAGSVLPACLFPTGASEQSDAVVIIVYLRCAIWVGQCSRLRLVGR
jgi:hypothetical protein